MNIKSVFSTLASVAVSVIVAQGENRTLFVHHTSGIDPIMYAEIDSIRFSSIGIDSIEYNFPVVQEVWTTDSVYRYKIEDILSTSFEAPATVARDGAIDLSGEIAKYVEGIATNEWGDKKLVLSHSIPTNLIPEEGQYIYQLKGSDKLPDGIAGEVIFVDGTEIEYYDVDLKDIFDTLVLDSYSWFETESTATPLREKSDGVTMENEWLAAVNTYPYGPSVVTQMTEELRDIPIGPEEPRVTSKIRVRPQVNMWAGVYVLGGKRSTDGGWEKLPVETHKILATVKTPVEAHVDGRAVVEAEHIIGSDRKLTFNKPFGLGRSFTVTFSGTMKLKGKMGLEYDYSAEYHAKSAVTTIISDNLAAMGGAFKNNVITIPEHKLDASMEGTLSLSASVTATLTNVADSLKSISSTFVYGTKLDGKALYLTSQLDEAESNNSLYRRITNHGVKASPIETVSASGKFGAETLKAKSDAKPTDATTFYAVPLFKSPTYTNGEMSFEVEGTAMKSCKSQLGLALFRNDVLKARVSTLSVWPGVKKLVGDIAADFTMGDVIFPTMSLCNKTILGAPSYPDNNQTLSPVTWVGKGSGIRVISGMPIVGKASNGKSVVYVGNLITISKPKSK